MRRNYRMMVRRICAAAALAITVTVGGVTALAPAASADVAVASAATRSAAPSSPQGPETLRPHSISDCYLYITTRYPAIDKNLVTSACSLVPAAITAAPHDWRAIAAAAAFCVGTFRKQGVSYLSASAACLASAIPTPFGQEEWCTTTGGTACLNAWGGGPWVNDYTGGFESRDSNQDFVLSAVYNANGDATGIYQLGFVGSGSWAGRCIGDAYNDSGYADVSLDGCGNGTGGGSGWGTNFTVGTSGCPAGEEWFHNNHWNGYLGPVGGAVNGSHFYLNKPTPYCFSVDLIYTVQV
jgi:hypothetical protein